MIHDIGYFNGIIGKERILEKEPLKNHTTFRIGGPADYLLLPETEEEIAGAVSSLKNDGIPFLVIGNGSNLLFGDGGFRGVIIKISSLYAGIENAALTESEGSFYAKAGTSLARISSYAAGLALSGLEFAAGIPGSLGGAVFMNAGAYGGEMCNVIKSVTYMSPDGKIRKRSGDENGFGYRKSVYQESGEVILGADFTLRRGDGFAITETIRRLNTCRREKQPLEFPSAGSAFKRPQGNFAGKLIEEAGLRGFASGGAKISEKHCGFIINTGNATAEDVLNLIEEVRNRVFANAGIWLEPEIRLIGEK